MMKFNMKKLVSLMMIAMLLCSFAQVAGAEDAINEIVVEVHVPAPATPAPTAEPVVEPEAPVENDEPTAAPQPDETEAPAGEDATEVSFGEGEIAPQDPSAQPTQEPQRSVYVVLHGEPGSFQYGDVVTMEAMLNGFDGASYSITWECSPNGIDKWEAAPGVNNATVYQFNLDQENALYFWRAVVDIR